MTHASDTLPNTIDALQALILAERAAHATIVSERDKLATRNERLEAIIQEIRRAHFCRKSERITDDQLALALDELETSLAKAEAEEEKADPALKTERTRKRRASRSESLDHLLHEEVVIEPESKLCPLLWRCVARHRRGYVQAPGQGARQGARDRHAALVVSAAEQAER